MKKVHICLKKINQSLLIISHIQIYLGILLLNSHHSVSTIVTDFTKKLYMVQWLLKAAL
jgi:hypothetical protein